MNIHDAISQAERQNPDFTPLRMMDFGSTLVLLRACLGVGRFDQVGSSVVGRIVDQVFVPRFLPPHTRILLGSHLHVLLSLHMIGY